MTEEMAQCLSQIRIKTKHGFSDVPCGRCGFCLQNRRKEWSFRLQKELKAHYSAFFLTFTYADNWLPTHINTDSGEVHEVLKKEDFQKFMKRLRKAHKKDYPGLKLKYYAVGEYGSETERPHYHAIIYSLHPSYTELKKPEMYQDRRTGKFAVRKISKIEEIWTLGMVHVGKVENDSIDYVTKYVINKYDFNNYPVPPFALISNGLGLDHLNKNYDRYKSKDVVVNNRGIKQKIPRYYRDKYDENAYTKAIRKSKQDSEFQRIEAEELERLKQFHPDPIHYHQERKVADNDRITRTAKKGDKL